jgi:hypothetical protein
MPKHSIMRRQARTQNPALTSMRLADSQPRIGGGSLSLPGPARYASRATRKASTVARPKATRDEARATSVEVPKARKKTVRYHGWMNGHNISRCVSSTNASRSPWRKSIAIRAAGRAWPVSSA